MDPVEEMLKTLEQMRLINREAQQSLKRLETVTLEDSRRGQRQWSIATAAAQMPKQVQPYPVKPADAGPAPIPLAPARPTLNPLALAPTGPQTYGLKDPNAVPLAPQTPAGPTPAANPYALQQVPQKIADSCDCFKDALAPLIALTEKIFAGVKAITGQINKAGYGGGFGGGGGDNLQRGRDYDFSVSSKDVVDTSMKGQLKASMGAAAGGLAMLKTAVTGPIEVFNRLTGTLGKFVEALNPSLMEKFHFTMRDLSATIGVAAAPMMQALTGLAREFGSVLFPAMKQLQPIVQQMAGALVAAAQPYLKFISELLEKSMPLAQLFADLSKALVPVVDIFYGVLTSAVKALAAVLQPLIGLIGLLARALQPIVQVVGIIVSGMSMITQVVASFAGALLQLVILTNPVTAVLYGLAAAGEMLAPMFEAMGVIMAGITETMTAFTNGLVAWIGGLLGADLSGVFSNVKALMERLATGIILVMASIAKALGFTSFIDGMKKALGGPKREDQTGLGAARDAQIGGLDSLRQSVMRASLLATPAGMKTEEQKWRDDTLKQLELLASSRESMVGQMATAVVNAISAKIADWARAARAAVAEGFDAAGATVKDSVKKGAGSVDRATGGVFSTIGRLAGF